LAFEVTKLTHGEGEARKARDTAHALFEGTGELAGVPETAIPQVRLAAGVPVVDLLVETGLAASKSAARRLIQQGGASLNDTRVPNLEAVVTSADVHDGALLLRAGKKHYHRVVVQ
jgi:tyrosyl-tRNA synthetase